MTVNVTGSEKIVVVDDDQVILQSMCEVLGDGGFTHVTGYLRAEDAYRRLTHSQADLLITDVVLPKMTGIELIHKLRNQNIQLPILAVSGYATIEELRGCDVYAFIEKPFKIDDLLSAVRNALAFGQCRESLLCRILDFSTFVGKELQKIDNSLCLAQKVAHG